MSWIESKKAIREIMSEPGPGGTLSWARVASSFALVVGVFWISYIFIKVPPHTIPELRAVLSENLRSVTEFVLAPYGSNKMLTTLQSFSSKNNQ